MQAVRLLAFVLSLSFALPAQELTLLPTGDMKDKDDALFAAAWLSRPEEVSVLIGLLKDKVD